MLDEDINCQGVLEPFIAECAGIWGSAVLQMLANNKKGRGRGKSQEVMLIVITGHSSLVLPELDRCQFPPTLAKTLLTQQN